LGIEHGNTVVDACPIYASTDAKVFGKVSDVTPADWLDRLLHVIRPIG